MIIYRKFNLQVELQSRKQQGGVCNIDHIYIDTFYNNPT